MMIKQYQFRIPANLTKEIAKIAFVNKRTKRAEIEVALRQYVFNYGKTK